MKIYKDYFVGDKAQKNKRKIIRNIKACKPQRNVYVLTLPLNKANVMDIYPAYVLLQGYYKRQDIKVIGIAIGRDEAYTLASQIIAKCYSESGNVRVENLFNN